MEDTIADLYYISEYALEVRRQIQSREPPTVGYVNRMAELAEKVQRFLDPELAKFVEETAHR